MQEYTIYPADETQSAIKPYQQARNRIHSSSVYAISFLPDENVFLIMTEAVSFSVSSLCDCLS